MLSNSYSSEILDFSFPSLCYIYAYEHLLNVFTLDSTEEDATNDILEKQIIISESVIFLLNVICRASYNCKTIIQLGYNIVNLFTVTTRIRRTLNANGNDETYYEFGSVELLERCKMIDHGMSHIASNVEIHITRQARAGINREKKAFEE